MLVAGSPKALAQEITYNLEPSHELGAELWVIPIGGKLTMSADGTRMLVASNADSAFFVVDVQTGKYRKTKARYYADNTFGFTYYRVDPELTILFEGGNFDESGDRYWDLEADTLVKTSDDIGVILGISKRLDRVVTSYGLVEFSTLRRLATYNYGLHPGYWFDEDRGVLYRGTINKLDEVDINSGETLRSWTIRAKRSEVRRPSNSDWIYVFAIESNTLDGQNWVEAINLVTGEHLKFSEYFWNRVPGQPQFRDTWEFFLSADQTGLVRGSNVGHHNPIWSFDGSVKKSQVVIDPVFEFNSRVTKKAVAIHPEQTLLIHAWDVDWKDSSITRCNALVPVATSVGEGENPSGIGGGVSTSVVGDYLQVTANQPQMVVHRVDIASIDGLVVMQQVVAPGLPINIPIGHLAAGTYVCSTETSVGRFSSTFAIVR